MILDFPACKTVRNNCWLCISLWYFCYKSQNKLDSTFCHKGNKIKTFELFIIHSWLELWGQGVRNGWFLSWHEENIFKTKHQIVIQGQSKMTEQEDVELTSPHKHIYMWNNSHGKLIGDWQSSTAEAVGKISTYMGRMERGHRVRTSTLRIWKKEGSAQADPGPGAGLGWATAEQLSLGVLHGGDKPSWLQGEPQELEKGWRSLDSTHKECAGAGLLTNRVERALHRGCHLTVLQNPSGATPHSAHSTPRLGTGSGADRPWEKTQSRDARRLWGRGSGGVGLQLQCWC